MLTKVKYIAKNARLIFPLILIVHKFEFTSLQWTNNNYFTWSLAELLYVFIYLNFVNIRYVSFIHKLRSDVLSQQQTRSKELLDSMFDIER